MTPCEASHYYIQRQQYAEALYACRQWIEEDVANPSAYGMLGAIYQDSEQPSYALMCYKKALDLDPLDGRVYINICRVLQQTNTNIAAIAYGVKAVELAPENMISYMNLGNVYIALGDPETAIACFKTATELKDVAGLYSANAFSNIIFAMDLAETATEQEQQEARKTWNRKFH